MHKQLSTVLQVIGIIHSAYKTTDDAPSQGSTKEHISEIEIFPEYHQGLQDIKGFSHLHIFYWLHQSNRYTLLVRTPWDTTPHGLFTTRSPHRPNPLGYAAVTLIKRTNTILKVAGLDAIEGTPVIDIKPYINTIDNKQATREGWTAHTGLHSQ